MVNGGDGLVAIAFLATPLATPLIIIILFFFILSYFFCHEKCFYAIVNTSLF